MKFFRVLTLIMTLSMLVGTTLVIKPAFAQSVTFTVQPVAVSPLTDIDPSLYVLETSASPSPVGQYFNVEVHLTGATPANVPAGVAGVEILFNFSQILPYAVPISFTDRLGTVGGVLNSPLLYGINPSFFDNNGVAVTVPPYTSATNYHVAAASTGGVWNGVDGIVVIIQFKILGQPSPGLPPLGDFVAPIVLSFSSAVDGAAAPIDTGTQNGTLHIDTSAMVYPPRAKIYVDPAFQVGSATLGAPVVYSIMIGNEFGTPDGVSSFWDIAGFDVAVSWDPALLTLVNATEGTFLQQGGAPTFGFNLTTSNSIEMVYVKLTDVTPSMGIDTLFTLNFAVTFVGTSYPAPSCAIILGPTDLALWPHTYPFGPWYGSITAADMPYDPNPVPPAEPWTHVRADGLYQAPYVAPGPSIDLYDQYPAPFGGQGPNLHSDSFAPQQLVCLFVKVMYGGDRVTNKLVSFEIHNALGVKVTILQNYSAANGVATVCFRIPQTDMIPGGEDPAIFGWWNVTATAELDQITANDTMAFLVGWLAQVTSVDAVGAPYSKYVDMMDFTTHVLTIHEQPITVLVSIDSYDAQGYPIGETAFFVTINATRTDTGTTPGTYDYANLIQPIPTWARVGTASVIGYALTDFPRNGGTPYGPQSPPTLFTISLA